MAHRALLYSLAPLEDQLGPGSSSPPEDDETIKKQPLF